MPIRQWVRPLWKLQENYRFVIQKFKLRYRKKILYTKTTWRKTHLGKLLLVCRLTTKLNKYCPHTGQQIAAQKNDFKIKGLMLSTFTNFTPAD